ncbi:MAG: ATP-binding protein, partial [Bacteroides sp.]|nr:ATP-binding protein [Bacteroides sp.]
MAACVQHSLSGIFCDIANVGKTFTARYYATRHPYAVYVDCSQVKSKQRLIRFIAKSLGLFNQGRYIDVYEDVVFCLHSVEKPLIILDEAGDLQYEAYLELKALWNATEYSCGWYQLGADALKAKIEKGIASARIGFAELRSRYGDKYNRITPLDGKEKERFLLSQAALIAKANAREGIDPMKIARESGGSARRVYTLLMKSLNS